MNKKLLIGIIVTSGVAAATVATVATIAVVSTANNANFKVNEEKYTLELGDKPEAHKSEYVSIKEEYADQVVYDFSKVDAYKEGEYKATASYKDKKEEFTIVVDDTIAPNVELNEKIVVEAGMPVYASDLIFSITEKSGEVKIGFSENECTEEEALNAINQNSGLAGIVPTDEQIAALEGDYEAEKEQAEAEKNKAEAVDVTYNNIAVLYDEKGDYVNTLTVEDINGNKSEFEVNFKVVTAPEITAADFSANVGEDVNYMNGVTAVDSDGNDITADITIDTSAVDLNTPGTYKVVYLVKDKHNIEKKKEITLTINDISKEEATTKTLSIGSSNNSLNSVSSSVDSGNSSGSNDGSSNTSDNSAKQEELVRDYMYKIPSGYSYDTFCTYNGMYGYFPSNPSNNDFDWEMTLKAFDQGYTQGATYQVNYEDGLLTFYYFY